MLVLKLIPIIYPMYYLTMSCSDLVPALLLSSLVLRWLVATHKF